MDTNYKIQIVIAGHPGFFEREDSNNPDRSTG